MILLRRLAKVIVDLSHVRQKNNDGCEHSPGLKVPQNDEDEGENECRL